MKKIGLTGSIGAGKSAVVAFLRAQDIPVHDADAAVHEIYRWPEMVVWLAWHFPVVMTAGGLDKKKLAEIIFEDPEARQKLEAIIHPAVVDHRAAFMAAAEVRGEPMVVCDIPLLFETGAEAEFDQTWLVTAPKDVRLDRTMARTGMTVEKFEKINAVQMSQDEKIRRADHVIENNGTLSELHERLSWLIGKK